MRTRSLLVAAPLALLPLLATAQEPADAVAAASAVELQPADIPVGVFHDGARLRVEAQVPSSYQVVVICRGADGKVELNKKGKTLGVLWMKVGEAVLEHVPALYQVNTVHSLDELAPAEERRSLGVGYEALEERLASDQEEQETRRVFRELVKLKEREGLYAEREHAVRLTGRGGGLAHLETSFELPARAPFGSYEVTIFGFREGAGVQLGTAAVTVRPVGLVAFMSSLAEQHGLLFGLLAVGVAIFMGLITGVIFGRGAKKVH